MRNNLFEDRAGRKKAKSSEDELTGSASLTGASHDPSTNSE